jgi:hypothetical protein
MTPAWWSGTSPQYASNREFQKTAAAVISAGSLSAGLLCEACSA